MRSILRSVRLPGELCRLPPRAAAARDELCAFVLDSVSRTGGRLSPNLGSVELAIALHYVFDTPHDRIV